MHGEVKTPPMSVNARREIGMLLRDLQEGKSVSFPHARPMPSIGARCHELRVNDENKIWRVICRIDQDAILILEVFNKTTNKTPLEKVRVCQNRLKLYTGVQKNEKNRG